MDHIAEYYRIVFTVLLDRELNNEKFDEHGLLSGK
jgi:hypothetical protein